MNRFGKEIFVYLKEHIYISIKSLSSLFFCKNFSARIIIRCIGDLTSKEDFTTSTFSLYSLISFASPCTIH